VVLRPTSQLSITSDENTAEPFICSSALFPAAATSAVIGCRSVLQPQRVGDLDCVKAVLSRQREMEAFWVTAFKVKEPARFPARLFPWQPASSLHWSTSCSWKFPRDYAGMLDVTFSHLYWQF